MGITLGIIGGIAPLSTVDYYRINSIDLTRLLGLIGDGRMGELIDWLATEIDRLARAGAGCALLAANTPHVVFDKLRARSPVPLLSIVEAAADAAAERGLHDVAVLGTRFTMCPRGGRGAVGRHGAAAAPERRGARGPAAARHEPDPHPAGAGGAAGLVRTGPSHDPSGRVS